MGGGLVGREVEALAVSEFLARVEIGPAGLVLQGEAGIGKTTLLLDTVDHAAAQGFHVLSARGSPAEVSYAYSAIADLLSNVDDTWMAGLSTIHNLALQRVSRGDVAGPATDERIVATAFLSLIERLSVPAAVLIVIDDAQWLDASSKSVIGFTARRLTGRTGLLVSLRAGESSVDAEDVWSQFRRPDAVTRLTIGPLSLGGTHALLANRLGRTLSRPTITRIHETSGGNPLFALELARASTEHDSGAITGLPDSLAALVHRRIGNADDDAKTVLLAAACATAPTVDLLAAATDMSATRVVELLEPLEDLGILELGADRVNFAHPLYATGVYTGATAARRRAMHKTLAKLVDREELSARHLALSATSPDPAVVAALDKAASNASIQGAPVVAAELLEMAIRLGGDEPRRRLRAAEQHFRSGDAQRADTVLDDATFGQLEAIPRIAAMILRAIMRIYTSSHFEAAGLLGQAADEASGLPVMLVPILLFLSHAQLNSGHYHAALDSAERATTAAEQLQSAAFISQSLAARTNARFHCGLGVDQTSLRRSLELQRPESDVAIPLGADAISAMILAWSGELDKADSLMRRVRSRCAERGADTEMVWVEIHSTMIDIWRGNYADAALSADEAVQRAQQVGGEPVKAIAFTLRAAVAAYAGREAEARSDAAVAMELASTSGVDVEAQRPIETLALIEVSVGHYEQALAVLQPRLDGFDQLPGTELPLASFVPFAVDALTALGRTADAEPLVAALEVNGARLDRPWMLAMGARGRGQILVGRGELAAAQDALTHAMEHHERLPMPFERARTQLLLGAVQRRRRGHQKAAQNLGEALRTFQALGAALWTARAQEELGRLSYARGDGNELTPTEQQVASLAATGSSNKQIAAHLFISEKTVEMNLSRVYRKLGIRSRAGLSAALTSTKIQEKP